jgi:predicted TIM-barrel fold metal-dependent hydrolase
MPPSAAASMRCWSFDKFPGARIILGHMGEFLPAQLFRIDLRYRDLDPTLQKQLRKLPSEYFGTNTAITTSAVFSHQALADAIATIGIDNVMFSIDYPFESIGPAAEFMRTAPLAPPTRNASRTRTPNASSGSTRSPGRAARRGGPRGP